MFLVDTQIFVWSISDTKRISKAVKSILVNNEIYLSQLSFYEIAIKQQINKLPDLPLHVKQIRETAIKDGFKILEISGKHIDSYTSIPLIPNHRDPFDRLLIATAVAENMFLISADPKFRLYTPALQLIENTI